ncbi:uracil-DNA glycosylase [Sporosarcina sp. P21c]|uniref:uracil-DNA glycosylase n=1 Tax=unclassified Sporosarcina TaxID=2647733 RepID=UPI000C166F52|nr:MULTISPECIES: uracil-DNA glycosylase [unclassified Sporosarcina]PIC68436.1 uracil-DNA glycosylase [Sporosarcina sp. P16a]PIC88963.1 uracil-DNA glycosylase [Sporosarcina sp. P21c]PIC92207.1 uracil-DNA glycosylase [Sporosarcina sp. P25]
MFRVPDEIARIALERSEGFPVEGFVHGEGPQSPTLLLIGEAPGEHEAIHGVPFIGRAGDELMKSLASIGLTREDVYMTSSFRSRPYKWGTRKERDGSLTERKYNRPPTQKEQLAHARVLDFEVANLQPKLIVTLGNIGLQRLLGKHAKVTVLHGQVLTQPVQYLAKLEDKQYSLTDESYTIIPTFHPASVFYRPSLRPELEADWRRIGEYLQGEMNYPFE